MKTVCTLIVKPSNSDLFLAPAVFTEAVVDQFFAHWASLPMARQRPCRPAWDTCSMPMKIPMGMFR